MVVDTTDRKMPQEFGQAGDAAPASKDAAHDLDRDDQTESDLRVPHQGLDHTRHQLRKLMQGWDNRLILEGQSRVKTYIEGRSSIVLVMNRRLAARIGDPCGIGNKNEAVSGFLGDVVIVLRCIDLDRGRNGMDKQESVLVRSVQLVEPNKWIPSAVRLYLIDDQVGDVGSDALYFSETMLTYERIKLNIDREIQIRVRFLECADDSPCEVIESTPQIVNCVSSHHLHNLFVGQYWREIDRRLHPIRLSVVVGEKRTRARLMDSSKNFFNISDVLVGPFDL
jgi:hypothetical protein